jgi:hypothetical protein
MVSEMAIVKISKRLEEEIHSKFRGESVEVFQLIYSLKENPRKGKDIGFVGNVLIRELKYKSFRFFFITDRYKVLVMLKDDLDDLIIKVIRMAKKGREQQKVIDEIKTMLKKFGDEYY